MLRLAGELFEQKDPLPALPDTPDYSALLEISKKHSMSGMIAAALRARGIHLPEFDEAFGNAMRYSVLQTREFKTISDKFCRAHIRHLPLKGILLKAIYPKPWMREMSDVDILIEADTHEKVKAVMLESGYTSVYYGNNNEDVYRKAPCFTFEIHRTLFDRKGYPKLQAYFDRASYKPSPKLPYLWEMSADDAYIYLIAHVFMHYQASGTGLKSLLDIRLYLDTYRDGMDFSYIQAELSKLGAEAFEKSVRQLSQRFLVPESLSPEEKEQLDYYIFSGAYGNLDQYFINRAAEATDGTVRSKIKYIGSRFEITDDALNAHPFYRKHPRLKPVIAAARFAKAIVKKPKRLIRELRAISRVKKPPHD